MTSVLLIVLLLLSHLVLLGSAEEGNRRNSSRCNHFDCGPFAGLKFPFFSTEMEPCRGLYKLNCSGIQPTIQLEDGGTWFNVDSISLGNTVGMTDPKLQQDINSKTCDGLKNWTRVDSPWLELKGDFFNLFKCNRSLPNNRSTSKAFHKQACNDHDIYYGGNNSQSNLPQCSTIRLPASRIEARQPNNLYSYINATLVVQINLPGECYRCHYGRGRGQCTTNSDGKFQCVGQGNRNLALELGLGITGSVVLLIIVVTTLIILHRRRKYRLGFLSRSASDPFSKSDVEGGNIYFGIPLFSYKELEQATSGFHAEKLLGDGGYGTVYYGKLQDGREVAVKRLYQHNYRRVEQFMNEIEILTRLRHKNLVSLYGCTSRRSHELLLVYEYIPNGTVADHLHGDLAKKGSVTWTIRMSIAVETANALAYLHASDIIHRDVKTNNILLDKNFSVKVADFGLSRLLPTDVTHVSTAPQGTPGYVDPEYYQCYQLTDKSDVYSFGVVLVELLSSMPAVDISRHTQEINLANLAVNKITKRAFGELIDPNLRHDSDDEIKRMTTLVAELAFRCLQQSKEMRPTMAEVVEELKSIQRLDSTFHNDEETYDLDEVMDNVQPPPSPPNWDDALLLKNIRPPPSPISVTEKWVSTTTTPSTSA